MDPLAAKYPDISPYAAFGGNPLVFVDNDGRQITYFGTAASFTKFKAAFEKEFAGKVQVKMSSINALSFTQVGKMTMTNQVYLFNQLNKYAKSSDDIRVNVGGKESDLQRETIIDNYDRSFFDLHDNEVLVKSTSKISMGANFLHFLTEQYHKQIELGLSKDANTDQGYADSHPKGIAEEFKAGGSMLADQIDLNDNTLNGKHIENLQTVQYSMVDKNQNLVGNLTIKTVGGSILQSNFDNSGDGVGKKHDFQNPQDKIDFSRAQEELKKY